MLIINFDNVLLIVFFQSSLTITIGENIETASIKFVSDISYYINQSDFYIFWKKFRKGGCLHYNITLFQSSFTVFVVYNKVISRTVELKCQSKVYTQISMNIFRFLPFEVY